MSSIRRQLATFGVVLAALYGIGFVAGQIIDPQSHGSRPKQMEHGSGH
ncbi:MAG: hypothetical protein ACR2NB_11310 [Solirubrobacteraceae bacterium]